MAEKHEITVKEHRGRYGSFKMFNISFETMQLYDPSTFDLFAFNNRGYFRRLITNFRGKDKVCYLLFRALTWHNAGSGGTSIADIRKVLDLCTAYSTLSRTEPGESRLFKCLGEEIHILMFKEELLMKMQNILNRIDSKGTWCFIIFAEEANKDTLFSNVERFFRNNSLGNHKNLLALGFDIIKFGNQGLWAEYGLDIFTNRYNSEQIKALLLDSMDREKFEVNLI